MDLPAIDYYRKGEADVPLGRALHRPGEDLPIREVVCPIAVDPDAIVHGQTKIGVWTLKIDLLLALQPVNQMLLHRTLSAPCGRGIVRSQLTRVEDERREFGRRHFRVLGVPICRVERQGPAAFSGRGSLHHGLQELALSSFASDLAIRIDT